MKFWLPLNKAGSPGPRLSKMNFMTGYAPSRKRNVYLRLRWTKRSGAKLEMVWKTEQGYYQRDGWVPHRIESVTDGLIHVNIQDNGNSNAQPPGR